jgi:hypothetical protein
MNSPNRIERHALFMNINFNRNFESAPEWGKWKSIALERVINFIPLFAFG